MIKVSTDLSAKFGPVRSQGQRLSCLGFAASDLNRFLNGHSQELSVEYLLHHAAKAMPNWTPARGLTIASVLAALAHPGQPAEDLYKYQPSSPDFPLTAPPALSPLYTSTCVESGIAIDKIVTVISGGAPVCIGVRMTYEFYKPVDAIISDSLKCPTGIGHVILVVGHGVYEGNGMEYFLVRNSWGPGWGSNGYAWLSKQYLMNHLLASFGHKNHGKNL